MKTTTINGQEIHIYPFPAKEALELRNEIIKYVKETAKIDNDSFIDIGKVFVTLLYQLPTSLVMKLLAKTSLEGEGNLNQEEVFNKVFSKNIDSVVLVILDIVDYNGFFSQNLFTELMARAERIPMLAKGMKKIKEMMKGNTLTSLQDLMKK